MSLNRGPPAGGAGGAGGDGGAGGGGGPFVPLLLQLPAPPGCTGAWESSLSIHRSPWSDRISHAAQVGAAAQASQQPRASISGRRLKE
jgi:hypothetical protein